MSEKEMTTHVHVIDGKVVVTFPSPVSYLNMTPAMARGFATLIMDCANQLEKPPAGTKPW
jgi:hypothetical protein